MSHHGRFALLTVAGLCAVPFLATGTQADDLADLKARLERVERDNEQLRNQVARLQQGTEENWLGGKRAEEVRALIQEVIADADTRASLLADAMTAGYQNGIFFLGSNDGRFLLQIGGLIQGRYIYNHRRGAPGGNEQHDNNEAGFDLPRIRLEVSGYIGDPRFTYGIRFGPDREDNEVLGEKAVIGYHPSRELSFYAGEDKAGFLREETTSPAMQLAVERSLMNEIFTVGYIQGIWMTWQVNDDLNFYASFNDGVRSGEADNEFNSAFILFPPTDGDLESIHKPFFLDHSDFAATFRLDWKLAGTWKQYEDFSAWSGEPLAIFLGAALHLEAGETGASAGSGGKTGSNDNFLMWTVDGSIEKDGFNLFASFVGLHTDLESGHQLNAYGAVIQAGYMIIPDKLEPYARIEWIDLDGRNTTGKNDLVILTFGTNYYVHRHRAKLSADVMWVVNEMPGSNVVGTQDDIDGFDQGLGHLGLRQAGKGDQWVLRLQFQLLF
jgi:hypothetical protein